MTDLRPIYMYGNFNNVFVHAVHCHFVAHEKCNKCAKLKRTFKISSTCTALHYGHVQYDVTNLVNVTKKKNRVQKGSQKQNGKMCQFQSVLYIGQ